MDHEGFLLIDKPAGPTSHDVVDRIRRLSGVRRVGHAGTLDPFATGLLVVGVGRGATRLLGTFLGQDKGYEGVMILGAVSDTQDRTGRLTVDERAEPPDESAVRETLERFVGEYPQVPPMFSAKKIRGRKLYELARAGQEVQRRPVPVRIHRLEMVSYDWPRVAFRVRCSSGTYVRTLAHDIGRSLGVGAYLETLRRTAVGRFRVDQATTLEELESSGWSDRLLPISEISGTATD